MSDPVTNVEIEDVLSSIRRLVSADDRDTDTHQQAADPALRPQEAKLILTPAQRIDEPQEDPDAGDPDIDGPEARQDGGARFDGIEDAEIVESRRQDHEADAEILKDLPQFIRSGARGHDHEEDEASESHATHADAWDVDDSDSALSDGIAANDDHDLAGEEPGLDDVVAEDATDDIDLKDLEARIAGFESAVAQKEDEWEPDGSSDDDYAAAPQSPLPWQDVEAAGTIEEFSSAAFDREPEPVSDPDGSWAEKGYDDGLTAAPSSSETIGQANRGNQDRPAETGWYSEEAILDEEALRDMVSEIVRQELQGALGERITRNVRKLVRREIHRALMSQGMD